MTYLFVITRKLVVVFIIFYSFPNESSVGFRNSVSMTYTSFFLICNLWSIIYRQTFKETFIQQVDEHLFILYKQNWGRYIRGKFYINITYRYILDNSNSNSNLVHFKYISPYSPSSIKLIKNFIFYFRCYNKPVKLESLFWVLHGWIYHFVCFLKWTLSKNNINILIQIDLR